MLVTFAGTAIHRMREEIQRDQFEILEEIAQAVSVSVRLTVAPYAGAGRSSEYLKGLQNRGLAPALQAFGLTQRQRDTLRYELLLGVEGA